MSRRPVRDWHEPRRPLGRLQVRGWGREMGPYALDAYTEPKGVWIHLPS
ncbi:acyl-CoA reductase-like NAD-dependent aldehyde dehydrogenase [Actinomadura coerulea]|uniref:Acyl-CoA reductase-like NAD-dependent aldehyde dehydrogenase n=1 Tax=Actinomadura coerulea TaxID=46159 RepID=A0A7X0KZT4_9ACTN|nr:hypothetical protein [Actinomadura coerulea]MBB6396484.1 acyl-CoA reductase-like NAD-dependent aldehyde dehydrogenase [Actinomadura coerulea]GGQ05860.1 hypothetical protein GCM10010187_22310 [Actinomadura coerulea]